MTNPRVTLGLRGGRRLSVRGWGLDVRIVLAGVGVTRVHVSAGGGPLSPYAGRSRGARGRAARRGACPSTRACRRTRAAAGSPTRAATAALGERCRRECYAGKDNEQRFADHGCVSLRLNSNHDRRRKFL